MNCPHIMRLLSACQDGELDPERRRQVELHLQGCAACRDEWQALQELERRLLRLSRPEVDPFFPTRVMAALPGRPGQGAFWRQAVAYAAVFAVIFLGGFLLQTTSGRQPAAPSVASTFSDVLLEPQGLGLLSVHDDTLGLFDGDRP